MLIKFYVENFRSFRDEVCLDLAAAKSRKKKDHLLVDESGKAATVVPFVAVYGANAAGKSNLVRALGTLQRLVVAGVAPDAALPLGPFTFDPATRERPSRFEVVIKVDGVVFTYGLVADALRVHEEWLFACYTARETKLFERRTKSDGKVEVQVGPRLTSEGQDKGFFGYVAAGTRPNQLFLAECGAKNVAAVEPVRRWFREMLQVVPAGQAIPSFPIKVDGEEEFVAFAGKYLGEVDTGVRGVGVKREDLDFEEMVKKAPPEMAGAIEFVQRGLVAERKNAFLMIGNPMMMAVVDAADGCDHGRMKTLQLTASHQVSDGSTVDVPFQEESDGTKRIFELVPALSETRADERVFVIDELDRSLHPHLCRHFVETFLAAVKARTSKGQLIVTTHQTCILDEELLRRDEVCFVEKDEAGASHLTSLAEYRVTGGLSYERGYLAGRFGAIPFLGDPRRMVR